MSKAQALPTGEEEIVERLIREISLMSIPDLLRKAVSEGARWGAEATRLQLTQQLRGVLGGELPPLALPASQAATGAAGVAMAVTVPAAGVRHIQCPVPGCMEQGNRANRNFCRTHFQTLSPAEMDELRLQQAQASKPPTQQVECLVPKCKNPGIRQMHNFCKEHYNTLSDKRKQELREKQRVAMEKKDKLRRAERARNMRAAARERFNAVNAALAADGTGARAATRGRAK